MLVIRGKKKKDTHTPMFTAALLTIARARKQPRCPSSDEWIKNCSTYIQWSITQSLKTDHICVSSNDVDESQACYRVK